MADVHKYEESIKQVREQMLTGGFKADALQKLGLIMEVEAKLAGRTEFASICLKNAIQNNQPGVLETIRDMAKDNYNSVANILGEKLTNKILNHE